MTENIGRILAKGDLSITLTALASPYYYDSGQNIMHYPKPTSIVSLETNSKEIAMSQFVIESSTLVIQPGEGDIFVNNRNEVLIKVMV